MSGKDLGLRLAGAIVGFVLGALVLIALYFLIQLIMAAFGAHHTRFRAPVFLIFLPVIGLIFGWKAGPYAGPEIQAFIENSSTSMRAMIAASTLWIIALLSYIALFEPGSFSYGLSRMSQGDMEFLIKMLLFPLAILWACYFAITKFIMRK